MNPKVDQYLIDGCGRCSLYKTEQCKVHFWPEILTKLRNIVLDCGLQEEYKWSQPCYTFEKKNILIVTAFKNYACLAFFKGALLNDSNNVLVQPGENSQAFRQFRFTTLNEVTEIEAIIKAYIFEAIEIEKAGLKIELKKEPQPIPLELEAQFNENSELKTAFEKLTPGRQRGYLIHFSQPKQSKTRTSRIEKCIPKIMNGEGLNDKY